MWFCPFQICLIWTLFFSENVDLLPLKNVLWSMNKVAEVKSQISNKSHIYRFACRTTSPSRSRSRLVLNLEKSFFQNVHSTQQILLSFLISLKVFSQEQVVFFQLSRTVHRRNVQWQVLNSCNQLWTINNKPFYKGISFY